LQAACIPHPELLLFRAKEKFDEDGKLTDDSTIKHLERYLQAFSRWVEKING